MAEQNIAANGNGQRVGAMKYHSDLVAKLKKKLDRRVPRGVMHLAGSEKVLGRPTEKAFLPSLLSIFAPASDPALSQLRS